MSSPRIIKNIKSRVLKSGDLMSGNLNISTSSCPGFELIAPNNGTAWIFKNSSATVEDGLHLRDTLSSGNYVSFLIKSINGIDDALKITNGTVTHNILTSNNFSNYALPLTGGSLKSNGNNVARILPGEFGAYFVSDGDNGAYRALLVGNQKLSADNRWGAVLEVSDGSTINQYMLYGEHNKPTAKDVEALAWCPNEDVNTSPSILAVVNSMNTGGSFFAVQGSSIINASDSPSPGAEFHYFVLMDTQSRKRVIAHHYNDGGFNIFTRRVFSGSWLDGAWVNLGSAFSNADTVDGYHGWEFARTAFTTTNDLNYLTFSGMYRINGGSGVNINAPSGIDWGQVLVVRGGGDTIAQVGFDYGGSRAWLRTGNPPECSGAGAWRPWYQFYTTGNIQKGSSSVPSDLQEDGIYIRY